MVIYSYIGDAMIVYIACNFAYRHKLHEKGIPKPRKALKFIDIVILEDINPYIFMDVLLVRITCTEA